MRILAATAIVSAVLAALAGCQAEPAQVSVVVADPTRRLVDDIQPVRPPATAQPASTTAPAAEPTAPATVTPVSPPAPGPDARPPKAILHRITSQDTLYSLARQHLGDAKRWPEIVKANPGLDPRKLKVGQVIVIPVK